MPIVFCLRLLFRGICNGKEAEEEESTTVILIVLMRTFPKSKKKEKKKKQKTEIDKPSKRDTLANLSLARFSE